jgi:AcrR family transcriptional regulator
MPKKYAAAALYLRRLEICLYNQTGTFLLIREENQMSNLMKKAIKASFLKLLDERPLTRITVVDIAAYCGINRNSFYYHYHDIPSLMEEIIRDETDNFIRAYPDISTLDECVDAVFSFILENRRSISHIYHSVKREVFEQYLMSVCSYVVRTWYDSVWLKTGAGADPAGSELMLRFIRYELFGACIDFMNQNMPAGAAGEAKKLLALSRRIFEPAADGVRGQNL